MDSWQQEELAAALAGRLAHGTDVLPDEPKKPSDEKHSVTTGGWEAKLLNGNQKKGWVCDMWLYVWNGTQLVFLWTPGSAWRQFDHLDPR